MLAELMVTAAVPVEVRATGSVAEEPSVTEPKVREVGLTVSPGVVGVLSAVPVPDRLTVAVGLLDELLVMVSMPAGSPLLLGGANVTSIVAVCFGLRVSGNVTPETL